MCVCVYVMPVCARESVCMYTGLITLSVGGVTCVDNICVLSSVRVRINVALVHVCVSAAAAGPGGPAGQEEVESGTRKKVRRLLSFQRYCHASRLLRGLAPHDSLHLLDDDYLGQAAVRTHAHTHTHTQTQRSCTNTDRSSISVHPHTKARLAH